MFSATVMRGTVAFFSGSSGRPNTLKRSKSSRVGSKGSPLDEDAGRRRAARWPDSTSTSSRLAVAGDAGDADDLAGVDLQVDRVERRQPVVVLGEEAGELEHDRRRARAPCAWRARGSAVSPIIMRAMSSVVSSPTLPPPTVLAAPQHRDVVGEGRHLAELVGDHQDGDLLALAPCRAGGRGSRRPRPASAPRSARRGSGSAGRDRAASGSRASASRRPRACETGTSSGTRNGMRSRNSSSRRFSLRSSR